MSSRRAALLAVCVLLAAPAPAFAAGPHAPVVAAGILGSLGGVFGGIGHALLGAFSWTIGLAAKFILTTIAALVKLLIPHSWLHKGVQIMEWIVAVPDYAGKVSSPGGGHVYGFAGINALRDLFMWLGVAVAPLTLVYATSRAMLGESEPVALPTLRVLAICVVIVSYPYWWQQAAALADQVTHTILALPAVSRGLYKLMEYAVDGVALGGWQLIDLGLMGAIALALLALIFLKVVVILLGALLYATGPLMIGLVATEAGSAAGARVGERGQLAVRAGDLLGGAVRGRRVVDRGCVDGRPADRGEQHVRDADRRAATRGRRAREPVAVPEGRQGSGRAVADAARWPARDLKSTARRYQDQRGRRPGEHDRPIAARLRRPARAGGRGRRRRARRRRGRRRCDRDGSSHRRAGRPTRDSRERRSGRPRGRRARSAACGGAAWPLPRGCGRGPDGARWHRQLARRLIARPFEPRSRWRERKRG